ncbi:MAG: hypothetical protein Q8N79_10050, partial [Candidatus Methanoperedens sp.]|nr:hypothetical protein [Candidatus Methanoperedens sp.]
EIMIQANDPDNGTGVVYGGLHGGNASVSHYGLKRNDLGGYPQNTDGYCNYCHNNASSPFYLSDSNKSIIEHTTNTSANISNASTLRCVDCHKTGRIHNASLNKTLQNVWTSGQKDFCAPCHKPKPTGSANKSVYQQGHDPVNSSSDRIGDCGFCHNASSQGVNGSTVRVHSPGLTNTTTTATYGSCTGCHNGTAVYTGAGKQILSHMPNASQYRGNTSTSSYSCEYCHNLSGKPSMHSPGMNRSNGTCETCHYNNTSPFKSQAKNITSLLGGNMFNHAYNGSANTTCKMCHNASGKQKLHLSKYASGDIADPQDSSGNPTFENRSTWNAGDTNNRGILVDCRDCHEKYNDTAPFYAPFQEANRTGVNLQEHVGKGYVLKNCYICHTNETISVSGETVIKPMAVHNATIEPLTGGANCTKCHKIGATDSGKAPGSMLVNFTAFNSSASEHRNLANSTLWGGSSAFGLIDTACWACHQSDGKQPERHPDLKDNTTLTGGSKAYRCADCHTIGGIVSVMQPSIYNNATKVYKHYPGAVLSGQKIHSTNFTAGSCQVCHNNSIDTKNNITASLNATVSHYVNRTGLSPTNLQDSCNTCHNSATTWGVPKQLVNSVKHSMGSACQGPCHNPNYYNTTTVNPRILHNASIGIYYDCYKGGCHTAVVRAPRGGR